VHIKNKGHSNVELKFTKENTPYTPSPNCSEPEWMFCPNGVSDGQHLFLYKKTRFSKQKMLELQYFIYMQDEKGQYHKNLPIDAGEEKTIYIMACARANIPNKDDIDLIITATAKGTQFVLKNINSKAKK
jgi:hypothetical protein